MISVAVFSISISALVMISALDVHIDLKYNKGFLLIFTVNIFSLYLYFSSGKNKKEKANDNKKKRKPNKKAPFKIIYSTVISFLAHSNTIINKISVPKVYSKTNLFEPYNYEALVFSFISLLIAYLETNTEKLYKANNAIECLSDYPDFLLDISIRTKFLFFIKAIISLSFKILKNKIKSRRREKIKYV